MPDGVTTRMVDSIYYEVHWKSNIEIPTKERIKLDEHLGNILINSIAERNRYNIKVTEAITSLHQALDKIDEKHKKRNWEEEERELELLEKLRIVGHYLANAKDIT